jgi:hypothetical protein
VMFTASYPATFVPEQNGKGLHVRFPDLPEALTAGDDLADTFVQAAVAWVRRLPVESLGVMRFLGRQSQSAGSA